MNRSTTLLAIADIAISTRALAAGPVLDREPFEAPDPSTPIAQASGHVVSLTSDDEVSLYGKGGTLLLAMKTSVPLARPIADEPFPGSFLWSGNGQPAFCFAT